MERFLAKLRQLKPRRGQGIVEYLMMLAVVVGVALVIGKMFKPQVSSVFMNIMDRIGKAVETVGGTGGGY